MLRYLLDTDHLTLYAHAHPSIIQRVRFRRGSVGICVATIQEILRGRLAKVARAGDGPARILSYNLLAQALQLFTQIPNVSYSQPAEDEFQRLRSVRIGTQDLKIASIARANQLIVATRNRRDFARVAGLTTEDWSV